MNTDGYLHIHECARILHGYPDGRRCGFIQRGPGVCPYDHGEDVPLVPVVAVVLCSKCGAATMADDNRAPDGRLVCAECVLVDPPTEGKAPDA